MGGGADFGVRKFVSLLAKRRQSSPGNFDCGIKLHYSIPFHLNYHLCTNFISDLFFFFFFCQRVKIRFGVNKRTEKMKIINYGCNW